ncbi:MAG: YigZ family protein [Gammaproteobacteria bacterium]|nr:YigZ family protein [Gammaproteobacteria bacterium]
MSKPFYTPASPLQSEIEVKKSRFIARALAVETREQVQAALKQARQDYPDARHHCWAYVLGNPATASSAAMNDDGEPGGTAGKPIMNVISHKGIGNVLVIVIRYFGGVKLGAGGLTRAYSAATEAVVSQLPLIRHEPRIEVLARLDFAQERDLRHWCHSHQATCGQSIYDQQVSLNVQLKAEHLPALREFCASRDIGLSE